MATPAVAARAKNSISPSEWQARVALAAVYRLADHYGWSNLIYNHAALRVPGEPDAFLFKAHHLMFSEVCASNLLKLDMNGRLLDESDGVNVAGFNIHSAILKARPDIHCTVHVHTKAGTAVSAHGKGLLPINQNVLQFHNRLSFHEYEGLADSPTECEHIVRDLGPGNKAMILLNHGLLTVGVTPADALSRMVFLVDSCEVQLALEATGAPIRTPSAEVCEHTAQQWEKYGRINDEVEWAAYLRLADRIDPSYRD
jgi:ribulose-5-phosphate 4-epimerase/fuculose-1-phosphate aldolase